MKIPWSRWWRWPSRLLAQCPRRPNPGDGLWCLAGPAILMASRLPIAPRESWIWSSRRLREQTTWSRLPNPFKNCKRCITSHICIQITHFWWEIQLQVQEKGLGPVLGFQNLKHIKHRLVEKYGSSPCGAGYHSLQTYETRSATPSSQLLAHLPKWPRCNPEPWTVNCPPPFAHSLPIPIEIPIEKATRSIFRSFFGHSTILIFNELFSIFFVHCGV